tara:strand:+ start:3249 stop:4613 length:1365 start_codon:yes stop_codon:yes gene_type:complete
MAYKTGTKLSSDVTAAATSAGVGTAPDRRRLYDFSDRVAELSPEESPFFVYLNRVSKAPTDDPIFRFLENRSKVDWSGREFLTQGAVNGSSAVSAGTGYSFTVDTSSGASVDWLVKGMVFSVNTIDSAAGWAQVLVRVDTAVTDNGSDSSFTGKVIDVSNSGISNYNVIADNLKCQVIGTAFAEGTGSPDAWSNEIEDDFGYTQIFKTSAEMSNTSMATRYRGYASEWDRIWALKLREHKVDIERAMLFGQRARVSGIQYTEGIVGHIVKNANPVVNDDPFSYSSGSPYYRSSAAGEFTYDRFLSDLEVLFDPARGGSSEKLVLASLPVVTQLNKVGADGFLDASTNATQIQLQAPLEERSGAFGHKVMSLDTIHGNLQFVKEPLFRGFSSGMMCIVDMNQVAYRPLVGNGVNRDTQIETNVQSADEDLRKDIILTEAGLEVTLPEAHALYNLE